MNRLVIVWITLGCAVVGAKSVSDDVQRFRDALTAAFPERMRSETAMPTTMALLGMINFTFAWLRPDGPLTHREFADLVIRLWEHGLSGPAPVRDGASRRVA